MVAMERLIVRNFVLYLNYKGKVTIKVDIPRALYKLVLSKRKILELTIFQRNLLERSYRQKERRLILLNILNI